MISHRRAPRDQESHADDWLITYADTITLLLCLFVVILTIRSGKTTTPREEARSWDIATTIAADIFAGHPPFPTPAPDGEPPTNGIVDAATWNDVPPLQTATAAPIVDPVPTSVPQTEQPPVPPNSSTDRFPSLGSAVAGSADDRITTLGISSAAFFPSGYAVLSNEGRFILRDVAVTLKSPAFDSFHVSIEGHTDDTPIGNAQFQSNWELSTARAASVVRFLLEQGIPPERLTAAGYADTFPVAPNRNADGTVIPENQASNRRVVIKLEKIVRADRSRAH